MDLSTFERLINQANNPRLNSALIALKAEIEKDAERQAHLAEAQSEPGKRQPKG